MPGSRSVCELAECSSHSSNSKLKYLWKSRGPLAVGLTYYSNHWNPKPEVFIKAAKQQARNPVKFRHKQKAPYRNPKESPRSHRKLQNSEAQAAKTSRTPTCPRRNPKSRGFKGIIGALRVKIILLFWRFLIIVVVKYNRNSILIIKTPTLSAVC